MAFIGPDAGAESTTNPSIAVMESPARVALKLLAADTGSCG